MANKQNEGERRATSCSDSEALGREREGLGKTCWVFFSPWATSQQILGETWRAQANLQQQRRFLPFTQTWPCPPPQQSDRRGLLQGKGATWTGEEATTAVLLCKGPGLQNSWWKFKLDPLLGINSLRVASIKPQKEMIRWAFSPHSYPLQSDKIERGHQLARRLLINSSSPRHCKASSCKVPAYLGTEL